MHLVGFIIRIKYKIPSDFGEKFTSRAVQRSQVVTEIAEGCSASVVCSTGPTDYDASKHACKSKQI